MLAKSIAIITLLVTTAVVSSQYAKARAEALRCSHGCNCLVCPCQRGGDECKAD